jgi:hypothetical protein
MAARKPAAKSEPKVELPEDNGNRFVVVTRDGEGNCVDGPGFRLLVQEGASDEDKAAGWNLGGEMPPEEMIVYVPKPQV